MDCVSCLLMGMCLLCGQNFGGSGVQTNTDTGAAEPGRAMTKAEFDSALQTAFRHLSTGSANTNSYRRQSKLDPRFSQIGIGKRRGPKLDPYNFSFGLGKRNFQDNPETQSDFNFKFEDPTAINDATFNFEKPNNPNLSEGATDLSDTVSLHAMPYYRSVFPLFLSKHFHEMARTELEKDFLEEERSKLQERRQRQRLDHVLSMAGDRR